MSLHDALPKLALQSQRCTVLQVEPMKLTLQDDEGNQFTLPRHFASADIKANDRWVVVFVDAHTYEKNQRLTAKKLLTELLQED